MSEPISINETCKTTRKFSMENTKLPIVIIEGKKYVECYNGAYYINPNEKKKIIKTSIEKDIKKIKYNIYRIYRINPQTNKLERGGCIQYIENLNKINPNDTSWIGENVNVSGRVAIHNNTEINDNISFYNQTKLTSYLKNKKLKTSDADLNNAINTINTVINQGQEKSMPNCNK